MSERRWRDAVIYQIYPRSFRDSNGDGIGDLNGITEGLDHIASLGVDAIWLSPFYKSPMRDFGYDVSDHVSVDPIFGTLADADRLIARAHQLGLKVVIDMVIGHASDRHAWFEESRRSRDNPKADWFTWADPRPDGSPPNNWLSVFSGSAWTWEPRRRQYYLHHFLSQQPSYNIRNIAVQQALLEVARFWFDRGVDGLRLDAIDFLAHDPDLRSNAPAPAPAGVAPAKLFGMQRHEHDMLHEDGLDFLFRLRELADQHGAVLIGEVSSQPGAFNRIANYTGTSGPLHTAYTLAAMRSGLDHQVASTLVREAAREDASVCWAFSNHDVVRVGSRWCSPDGQVDQRIVEMVAAFQLSLRGQICLYQGEELGLPEAELTLDELRDPFGIAFWPEFKGRDGSRTPFPWKRDHASLGFSAAEPWLPAAADHAEHALDVQEDDPESLLQRWRMLLAWRQNTPEIRLGSLHPLELAAPFIGFLRRAGERETLCLFNLSAEARTVDVPGYGCMEVEGWGYRQIRRSLQRALPELAEAAA